jgi:hypothetical protein
VPNPWLLLGVGLAWLASLASVGWWQRHDGALAERTTWQAREVLALTAANAKIKALNDAARDRESQHAAQMDAIGTWLAKETNDAQIRQRDAVRNARALVLRNQPACVGAGGSEAGPPRPAASGGNGQAACELPAEIVRDMESLVFDADSDVRQLYACQQVVLKDRAP